MGKSKKITKMTPLERKCLRKFYLDDAKLLFKNGPEGFKSLGLEKGLEVVFKLAEEKPILIKVLAKSETTFVVLFDEKVSGKFEPIYIMKDGKKEF